MVLASGYEIDTESFKNYCLDTAKYYITLYPWYYMPASVHKILIQYGADFIQHALLPIGNFSKYLYYIRTSLLFYILTIRSIIRGSSGMQK